MPTCASGGSGGERSVPGGFDVVTGAFSYSGAAIARDLLAAGRRVRTVTGHPGRAVSGTPIEVRPLDFADPAGLTSSLRGAGTLYNTYWVRFPKGPVDHRTAVANSRTLFHAARDAGVARIVHVSITHPSAASPYSYFRGKAEVERILGEAGVPYAILRPAILFGGEGVHIDDLAWLCLAAGSSAETYTLDAVGPERPAFYELVRFIKDAIGSRSRVVRVPGALIPAAAQVLGWVVRDTLLTGDEYRAMADGLADTDGPATGQAALTGWITENKDSLGRRYANEIDRH